MVDGAVRSWIPPRGGYPPALRVPPPGGGGPAAGYRFGNRDGARMLMEALENCVSGDGLGVVLDPAEGWFVMFEWDECDCVKDDDRRMCTCRAEAAGQARRGGRGSR